MSIYLERESTIFQFYPHLIFLKERFNTGAFVTKQKTTVKRRLSLSLAENPICSLNEDLEQPFLNESISAQYYEEQTISSNDNV